LPGLSPVFQIVDASASSASRLVNFVCAVYLSAGEKDRASFKCVSHPGATAPRETGRHPQTGRDFHRRVRGEGGVALKPNTRESRMTKLGIRRPSLLYHAKLLWKKIAFGDLDQDGVSNAVYCCDPCRGIIQFCLATLMYLGFPHWRKRLLLGYSRFFIRLSNERQWQLNA
jgi:hypothetical protein